MNERVTRGRMSNRVTRGRMSDRVTRGRMNSRVTRGRMRDRVTRGWNDPAQRHRSLGDFFSRQCQRDGREGFAQRHPQRRHHPRRVYPQT